MAGRRMGRKGDDVPHVAELLDALGRCRRPLLDAASEVRPFGTSYHAIQIVVTAIDTLAYYLTGQRGFFDLGGSVRPGGGAP